MKNYIPTTTQVRRLRLALTMAGVDMTLRVYEAVRVHGGDFDLKMAAKIQADVNKRWKVEPQPTRIVAKKVSKP